MRLASTSCHSRRNAPPSAGGGAGSQCRAAGARGGSARAQTRPSMRTSAFRTRSAVGWWWPAAAEVDDNGSGSGGMSEEGARGLVLGLVRCSRSWPTLVPGSERSRYWVPPMVLSFIGRRDSRVTKDTTLLGDQSSSR